jgi:anti-anti-sigma factor
MKIDQTRQGTVMVLKPNAALVEEDLAQFQQAADEQLSAGSVRLVFDFAEMPFIASEGLEALLDLSERAARLGGGIRIASPCEITRDILVATRLAARIEVFGEIAAARKSFL